jgi:hypothetical protein
MTENNVDAGGAATADRPALTGVRRGAYIGYQWVLAVFLLLGVVQIFLAGLGVFDLNGKKLGAEGETAFDPHRMVGFAMSGLSLIILILALIARRSVSSMVLSVVLVLLSAVAQSVLAGLGEDAAFFGGLHALDGLAILGIAGYLHGAARKG